MAYVDEMSKELYNYFPTLTKRDDFLSYALISSADII